MTNSIAILSLIFLVFVIPGYSYAQLKKPGFTLGINAFYANPKDNFRNEYRGGLGGEVKAGLGLGKTYFVASVGYAGFIAETNNGEGTLTYMPVKLGVKQYFLAKRLFINGDIGVAFLKNKSVLNEKRLAADIGFGARLLGLEAGVYFDYWKNAEGISGSTNAVLYKLGYNFTL
jgi:hypothetical protein